MNPISEVSHAGDSQAGPGPSGPAEQNHSIEQRREHERTRERAAAGRPVTFVPADMTPDSEGWTPVLLSGHDVRMLMTRLRCLRQELGQAERACLRVRNVLQLLETASYELVAESQPEDAA